VVRGVSGSIGWRSVFGDLINIYDHELLPIGESFGKMPDRQASVLLTILSLANRYATSNKLFLSHDLLDELKGNSYANYELKSWDYIRYCKRGLDNVPSNVSSSHENPNEVALERVGSLYQETKALLVVGFR